MVCRKWGVNRKNVIGLEKCDERCQRWIAQTVFMLGFCFMKNQDVVDVT